MARDLKLLDQNYFQLFEMLLPVITVLRAEANFRNTTHAVFLLLLLGFFIIII